MNGALTGIITEKYGESTKKNIVEAGRKMSRIKAVLFDMDGVLINTEPLHYRMWKEAFKGRGLDIDYDIYKHCIGATDAYLMDLILDHYGRDFRGDVRLSEERAVIEKRMLKEEGFPEMSGVREMLRTLHETGFLLAVASSSPLERINDAVDYIGARQYFSLLNSAENVARSKPAPDIYLDTAQKLGVLPEECIVLEDSENGSIAAVSAGMICVGLDNPDSGDQNLERAVVTIAALQEFTPELIRNLTKECGMKEHTEG